METRVSEVSWNSLDSLVSGDDPSGFGSFSDFLAQADQDAAARPLDPEENSGNSGREEGNIGFPVAQGNDASFGYQGEDFSPKVQSGQDFGSYQDSLEASFGSLATKDAPSYDPFVAKGSQEVFNYQDPAPTQAATTESLGLQSSQNTPAENSIQAPVPATTESFGYQAGQNTLPQSSFSSHLGGQDFSSYQEETLQSFPQQTHSYQNASGYQGSTGQRFPQQMFGYQQGQDSFPTQQTGQESFSYQGQNSFQYQNSFQPQIPLENRTSQTQISHGGFSYQTGQPQVSHDSLSYQTGQPQTAQGYQVPEYPGWTYNYQTGQWEQSTSGYYGSQQQFGQGYANYAGNNGSTQDYHSYTSSQYQFGQPANYAVTPPRTQEEAFRSTAGRPPCTVTAFGFGGRLVIMKPKGAEQFSTSQPFQIFQMNQLADFGLGYGHSSGPLAGNASMKDVMKWLDEKTMKLEESGSSNLASLRYMWGVLKICCQHYGNLRSTVNIAAMGRQDDNGPEVALAKLLEPSKSEESWAFGSRCLQTTPTEQQMQATAFEVKRLLIAGKQKEALRAAQDGQLWGCALLMARQLGEKFYTDTIAEMAQRQFQPGFPLRTLTLLYAGQHAGVFVGNTNLSNVTALQPQPVPASAVDGATQDAVEGMLEEWQENLAIMAANRTNGDERVIMHLGDCLWRHRDEICGAHICYLVANASFEPFSPSARLCLIGADHCKYPRTYASPEAIQRTEVYEFARVTGNSQFILLPFQPYKLIYASMLAEAGKINEALRYCLAVLKTLKTAGHAADVCKEAAVALEERLRIHSQGGSTSIVQRFFGNIGLHKMIGPSPPKASDNADINNRPATASSRSSVSLASSASMEPISDITRRSNMPARSISEPDFRPAQIVSPAKGTPNRGVFTSFVQRAMGFIKTPSKEAKLGDSNKFRYDETLKRWVEEGAEAQAPELPLAPPPTANRLVSRVEENGAPISISPERPQPTPERSQPVVSGIPPMPPSSNQYAARARQNVRSRYVDTFNKGSVTPSKTSSDSPPLFGVVPKASAKPLAPARFFVPAAAAAAAPDINSNHSVDPYSAPAFVSDTAFSNGNGAFAQPVVQDMRNDPGPTPDHLSSSSSPAMFYSNHYPAAPSTVSLPPPPALEVTPPVMVEQQQQNQHQESSIHRHHHQQSGTVGFEAASSSGVFGDDLQEVEL